MNIMWILACRALKTNTWTADYVIFRLYFIKVPSLIWGLKVSLYNMYQLYDPDLANLNMGSSSSDSMDDKAAGASSLECLSSIVDRLSSVESSSCGPAGLRNTSSFSPGSSDSQPCTPESPGSRPVYHVLWRKPCFDVNIYCLRRAPCFYPTPAAFATKSDKN